MYGEQGFKAAHKTVHLVKFIEKKVDQFFFQVLTSRYLVQQSKYCMVPTYLAAQ